MAQVQSLSSLLKTGDDAFLNKQSNLSRINRVIAIVGFFTVFPIFLLVSYIRHYFFHSDHTFYAVFSKSREGLVQRTASKTALMVATVRYAGYREGWTNDSLARYFIPSDLALAVDFMNPFRYPLSLMRFGSLMARTLSGDRLILNSHPRQVILLGAGLDTRAHRLELPGNCRVFEIDIATTQGLKKKIAEAHPDEFRGPVTYIPVDFSNESFIDKLLQNKDFDPKCTETVVIFEGVSMYLPWEALKSTMEMISHNLAEGTIVGMDVFDDYFTNESALKRETGYSRGATRLAKHVGEPWLWGIPEGETAEGVFSPLGFEVYDAKAHDIENIFLTPRGASKPVGFVPGLVHYLVLRVQRQ